MKSYSPLLLLGFIFLAACKEDTPVMPKPVTLVLTAENASCTEAWLQVTASEVPASVRLLRDGQRVYEFRLTTGDSSLFDEGLLPNHTYTYQLGKLNTDSGVVEMSPSVQVTTMDTTSHSFQFSIDTLGVTASVLYDVAIISDNDVWAVGELYLNDSTGQLDPILYNAAHWDGARWNVMRIPYIYQGTPTYSPIRCLFALNSQDIWFGNSTHWNGHQVQNANLAISIFYGVGIIDKIWAGSAGELYVVGSSGTIAYSSNHGTTWERVESGTTLEVYDVYGFQATPGTPYDVYAVAAQQFVTFDKRILRVAPTGVSVIPDSGIPYSIHGIWSKGRGPCYVVGSGIYRKGSVESPGAWQALHPGLTPYYIYAVRGNDVNDIFACGSLGELLHFNGASWKSYRDNPGFPSLEFYEVACRENAVVAVGYMQSRAVVAMGRRL